MLPFLVLAAVLGFGYMAMAKKQKELLPGGFDVSRNVPVGPGEKYAITFRFTPALTDTQFAQWVSAYKTGMESSGTASVATIQRAPAPGVVTAILTYRKATEIHTAPFMMGNIRGETIDVRRV